MRNCSNCGKIINKNSNFCTGCGMKVKNKLPAIVYINIIIVILTLIVSFSISVITLNKKETPIDNSTQIPNEIETNVTQLNNDIPENTYIYSDEDVIVNNLSKLESNERISRTIMIYMVGADLESEGGLASTDINEMLASNLDEYTNVYIYTGGALKWHNREINSRTNAIYKITDGKLEFIKEDGLLNTGLSSTLSNFINYVTNISKTDRYGLILWDHGGGPIVGYGSDQNFENDSLSIIELKAALDSTNLKEQKLEFLGFDACLMGSLEVSYALKDYSNYLIASEEIEPGTGWNYAFLNNISKISTDGLAKKIIDEYSIDVKENSSIFQKCAYTLSYIDLSKIEDVVKELNNSFKEYTGELNINYETFAKYRLKSLEFGKISSTDAYDLIDLKSLIEKDEHFNALKNKLNKSIKYSRANLINANGLTIFFPYTNKLYATRFINEYKKLEGFEEYANFIEEFNNIRTGKTRTEMNLKTNEIKFEDNKLSIELTEEELENYSKANYIIFEKFEDNSFLPVYKGTNLRVKDNKLIADYNNKMFVVSHNGEKTTMPLYEVKETSEGTLFHSIVLLLNFDGTNLNTEIGSYQFFINENEIKENGIIPYDEENLMDTKIFWTKEDWPEIQFTNFRYYILDDNGNYTNDWESLDTKYLFSVSTEEGEVSFEMEELETDKEYYGVINIYDLQGNMNSSELIKIK